jgi:hypothetical protein
MIYNVVLNSNLRVVGSTTSNANYYFDWASALPQGKYKLTWVFVGAPCDMNPLLSIPMLEINIGQSSVFRIDPTNVQAASTTCVGILTPSALADACYLYGDLATNPPIFLAARPSNNAFNVRIKTNDALSIFFLDSNGEALPEYVLTLSFESVK